MAKKDVVLHAWDEGGQEKEKSLAEIGSEMRAKYRVSRSYGIDNYTTGYNDWYKRVADLSNQIVTDATERDGKYQSADSFGKYYSDTSSQIEELLAEGQSYYDYFSKYGGYYDDYYEGGFKDKFLEDYKYITEHITGKKDGLSSEEQYWANFEDEEAWKWNNQLLAWEDASKKPENADMTKYVSTKLENFSLSWGARRTPSHNGYGDVWYDAINGDEEAIKIAKELQVYSVADYIAGNIDRYVNSTGWLDATPEQVATFNFIYNSNPQNVQLAYDYLDTVTSREYSITDALSLGILNGLGVESMASALAMSISNDEQDDVIKHNAEKMSALTQEAQAQRPFAFASGDMTGNVLLLTSLSQIKIHGMSGLPKLAQTMINGAALMGGKSALSNAGELATGNKTFGEYAADVGVSAVSGAAGSAASYGIGVSMRSVLSRFGLEHNVFAKTIAAGFSGATYTVGSDITTEITRLIGYDGVEKLTLEQLGQDALVGFAFGSINYLTGYYSNRGENSEYALDREYYAQSKNVRPTSKYFSSSIKSVEELKAEYRKLAKQYHPDAGGNAQDFEVMKSEYDALLKWFATAHAEKGFAAYKTYAKSKAGGDETKAQKAAQEFASEVRSLVAISEDGTLPSEMLESINILSSVASGISGGMIADSTVNLSDMFSGSKSMVSKAPFPAITDNIGAEPPKNSFSNVGYVDETGTALGVKQSNTLEAFVDKLKLSEKAKQALYSMIPKELNGTQQLDFAAAFSVIYRTALDGKGIESVNSSLISSAGLTQGQIEDIYRKGRIEYLENLPKKTSTSSANGGIIKETGGDVTAEKKAASFVGESGVSYNEQQATLLSSVSLEVIQNARDIGAKRDIVANDLGLSDTEAQAWVDAKLATVTTGADGTEYIAFYDTPLFDEGYRRKTAQGDRFVNVLQKKAKNDIINNDIINKHNSKKESNYESERTDEFRRVQEESRGMSDREIQEYHSGKELSQEIRGRLQRTFELELHTARSLRNYSERTLLNPKTNKNILLLEVDGILFHDVFEIARNYLENGELVDLHNEYNNATCYLTEDGLSGFSIENNGNLVSVFNLSSERGFLKTIAPIIKEKATMLDCYASERQDLQKMYSGIFGFQTASIMDYNMEYDHDNIAENHGMPKVAFMVNTDTEVETRKFNKDQYDEAVEYQRSFVENKGNIKENSQGDVTRGQKGKVGDTVSRRRNSEKSTGEQSSDDQEKHRGNEGAVEKGRLDRGGNSEELVLEDSSGRRISEDKARRLVGTAIVDYENRPIEVVHATNMDFDAFEKGDIGFHFGSDFQAQERARQKNIENPKYVRAYLNIKNPIMSQRDTMSWQPMQTALNLWDMGILSLEERNEIYALVRANGTGYDSPAAEKLRDILEGKGYDGIAYPNGYEGEGMSYIAFHDEQIVRVEKAAQESELTAYNDGAIWRYKSSESYKINEAIRSGRELTAEESAFIEELDRELEKAPKYSGVTYRNISFDMQGQEAFEAFVAEHVEGEDIMYPAYTSTSKSKTGYVVDGALTAHIEIYGENGHDISRIGNEEEQEVLFDRKTEFEIKSIYNDGKTVNIVLEEIGYGEKEVRGSNKGDTARKSRPSDSEGRTSSMQQMQTVGSPRTNEKLPYLSRRDTQRDTLERNDLQGFPSEIEETNHGIQEIQSKSGVYSDNGARVRGERGVAEGRTLQNGMSKAHERGVSARKDGGAYQGQERNKQGTVRGSDKGNTSRESGSSDTESGTPEVQRMQTSGQMDVQKISKRDSQGSTSQRSDLQGVREKVSLDADSDVQHSKNGQANTSEWSAERIKDGKATEAKPISEIIERIRHDFGINITKGHIRGKGVLGQYSKRNHGIRTRIANDLPTVSHELGHALDQRYGLTDKSKLSNEMRAELINALGDLKDSYKQNLWISEGFAEYIRRFLQNRDDATRAYPEFTKHFLNSLSKEDRILIDTFADEINAYYALDADTATSSIRLREEGVPDARTPMEKALEMGHDIYQAWVDANHGIRLFDEATGANTYKLASNAAYSDAIAGQIITGDLTDVNGQYVGPGLKAALEGVDLGDKKIYREFGEYLVLRHGPERLAEGMMIFADPRKNTASFMAERQAKLEAAHPEFKEAADRLYKFEKQFLYTWGVKTGLIPESLAESWWARWDFYVPLNRAVGKAGMAGAKRGYANQNSTIKKAIGSGLDIVHPVDNIINNIVKMVNAGVRNNVMLEITAQAEKLGADAIFLEKVPTPMKKKTADLTGVKAKLHNAFGTAGIGELLAEVERESEVQARKSENKSRISFQNTKSGMAHEKLSTYNEELSQIIKERGDIIIDSYDKLREVVNLAFDEPNKKATAYLGSINPDTLQAILADISNLPSEYKDSLFKSGRSYSIAMTLDSIQHIADEKNLSREDIIDYLDRLASTILDYDSVSFDYYIKGMSRTPGLLFKKTFSDGSFASFDLISQNKKSILLQTFYMNSIDYQKKKSANTLLMHNSPSTTSKTQDGQTSSTDSISHKNENVNKKISTNSIGAKSETWSQVDEIIESAIDDVLVQYGKGKAHGDVVTVLRNGKEEFWKINDALLLESLTSLSQKKMNGVMEAYAVVSRFMTSNITGNNIVWSIFSNFPRDIMTFFTYSKQKNPLKAFPAMGEAYLNKVTDGKVDTKHLPYIKEYYALGGGQTSAYTADVDLAKRARKKLKNSTKLQSAAYYANPLNLLSFISETVESGPRIATYIMMREQGMSPQEAFYESQDITVNFKRGGRLSRDLNKAVPFFNASVQGLDKFRRWITCADVPKATRAKAIVGRTITYVAVSAALGALFYALNNRDDEEKENYRLLSNYTKNSFWNIPLGDGRYFAIPKPREIAVLSTFIETTCEYIGGNDYAYDEFGEYVADNFLPPFLSDFVTDGAEGALGSLGMIGVVSDLRANKDFLGRPIESTALQNYESQDRYTRRTSMIAYWLGQAAAEVGLDWSPVQVDYFFGQTLGGYWKVQKALFPVGSENFDWTLGVQNTYVKDNQYSNDIVNWLYDEADASSKAKNSNPDDMDIAIEAKLDSNMKTFYSRYYALTKGQKESFATRHTKRVVLDMIMEYRKATDNGDRSLAEKTVYDVVESCGDVNLLPSVMQSTIKDLDGNSIKLDDVQYVEYQTTYNDLYWSFVEDGLGIAKTNAEKVAVLKQAQSVAKERATEIALKSAGGGSTGYFDKYDGVNDEDIIKFKAQYEIADDKNGDANVSQDEVIEIITIMLRDGLEYEDAYTLFKSRYDSDKNNPWRRYAP